MSRKGINEVFNALVREVPEPGPPVTEAPAPAPPPTAETAVIAPAPVEVPKPEPSEPSIAHKPVSTKLGVRIPQDILEDARNAAYWLRLALDDILTEAVGIGMAAIRNRENGGKMFDQRKTELRRGRKIT